MLWGSWVNSGAADAAKQAVRNPAHFNWTFIFILAVVVIIYTFEVERKDWKPVAAALSLYAVHWFYEIVNAVICKLSGYALWTVSPQSTSFILLIGVSWELSMMFAIAGFTSKLLPKDPKAKLLGMNNRIVFAVGMAAFFSCIGIFLAWTPAFIWVYPWWGAVPVFITTYIPFFLASFLLHDAKPKTQRLFIGGLFGLDVLLLAVLIPLGVI